MDLQVQSWVGESRPRDPLFLGPPTSLVVAAPISVAVAAGSTCFRALRCGHGSISRRYDVPGDLVQARPSAVRCCVPAPLLCAITNCTARGEPLDLIRIQEQGEGVAGQQCWDCGMRGRGKLVSDFVQGLREDRQTTLADRNDLVGSLLFRFRWKGWKGFHVEQR